jgi:hypothetical protein
VCVEQSFEWAKISSFKLKANERNKSKLEEQFNTAEGE